MLEKTHYSFYPNIRPYGNLFNIGYTYNLSHELCSGRWFADITLQSISFTNI